MSQEHHHIESLCEAISRNTHKVTNYWRTKRLPFPSFDTNGPVDSGISLEETEIQQARVNVIQDTRTLHALMLGPRDFLQSTMPDEPLSLQAITRFDIAKAFPIDEEATFAQIAKTCGLDESVLKRLLRHAMTKRVFREPHKGVVAHTAASKLLATDQQIHDWVRVSTDELWQGTAQTVNAIARFPMSQEPNQTGFSLANGTDKSVFEYFDQYPERAQRFGNAMISYTSGTGFELSHLVHGFDWRSLGKGHVVDIGGSNGFVSLHLASLFPDLRFTVQELKQVVANVEVDKISQELQKRVKFMPHNFLTEQPVKDADVYFFRWVFHDWSDLYCHRILRNLVPALKPGALILINDNVLPEPGTLGAWQEQQIRSMDLAMLEMQNARERELDDWAALFREADSRFEFLDGEQPAGSRLYILKARWGGSHALP
ncbi:hypothetical protein ACLMJK_000362 [Lecanora helva]